VCVSIKRTISSSSSPPPLIFIGTVCACVRERARKRERERERERKSVYTCKMRCGQLQLASSGENIYICLHT